MIKTITTPSWEEIEKRINQLPEDQKTRYHELKDEYKKETAKPHPNHERIKELITAATKLLKP